MVGAKLSLKDEASDEIGCFLRKHNFGLGTRSHAEF